MCDFKAPARVLGIYKKLTFEPKSEIGTKLGFLTDINKDNIPYCKALRKLAIEVRHLDGVKANFAVRNTECIGIVTMNEELQQPEQQEQKDDEGLQQPEQQEQKDDEGLTTTTTNNATTITMTVKRISRSLVLELPIYCLTRILKGI